MTAPWRACVTSAGGMGRGEDNMNNIFPTVCLIGMLLVGLVTGYLVAEDSLLRKERLVAADKNVLHLILKACDYDPHAISDVSWDLYRQQLVPLGTAIYYTNMMKSVNRPAATCLGKVLPEQWPADGS